MLAVAGFLVAAQVALRGWLVVGRDYYADDFRLLNLAEQSRLLSPSYLLHDFHGQFMPGGFLTVGLVERVAPLEWWPAAVMLIVFQALASLALVRVLWVLLGNRPVLLVPLVFGLFTPLTLGSTSWWAAALNSLPLQIGLAWYLADAVRLSQTGRRRYAVSGPAALAFALAFYLKAVLLPAIAFVVVVVVLFGDDEPSPVTAAWQRARLLWFGSMAVIFGWAAAYLMTKDASPVGGGDLGDVVDTVTTGFRAMAPSVLGGPFTWSLTTASAPFASLPAWSVYTGAVALGGAFVWTVLRLRGALVVWALVVGTAGAGLFMAGVGRSGLGMGNLLPLAYRYFAGEAVLLPVAAALLLCLPTRTSQQDSRSCLGVRRSRSFTKWTGPVMVLAVTIFIFNSVQSTLSHSRAWDADRTGEYLANVRESLSSAGSEPLLDQAVPADVMWPLAAPDNLISRMFSPLPDQPPIATWTSDLRMLDDDGHLRSAAVLPRSHIVQGPASECGWAATAGAETRVALTDPLDYWEWTIELSYVSDSEGTIALAMDPAEPVEVPVFEGANTVFVRIVGGGESLRIATPTPGVTLCIDGGGVGDIVLE